MTQVPGHVLQNAFGDIGVELVTRDLRGEEEGCKQRSLGVAWVQGAVSILQGGGEGAWVLDLRTKARGDLKRGRGPTCHQESPGSSSQE